MNESIKEIEDQITKINERIAFVENELSYILIPNRENLKEELDSLVNKKSSLYKEKAELNAKTDSSYIQDKELRDFIFDFTNGEYRIACVYTQKIVEGFSEEEATDYVKKYICSTDLTNKQYDSYINNTKKLKETIETQEYTDKLLVRFERTQMSHTFDDNLIDVQKKYIIGEKLQWGIISTSKNPNFIEKINSGNDIIKIEDSMSAFPYTYTEFKIVGEKKALDISKYSIYPDQEENLVCGNFIVENVENFVPKQVYDEKEITFDEYLKNNNYLYELRTSKKGNRLILIKTYNNQRVLEKTVDYFLKSEVDLPEKIKSNYSDEIKFRDTLTLDDVLIGKVAFKIEKTENKEKSTYGLERQIVTIKQILD